MFNQEDMLKYHLKKAVIYGHELEKVIEDYEKMIAEFLRRDYENFLRKSCHLNPSEFLIIFARHNTIFSYAENVNNEI